MIRSPALAALAICCAALRAPSAVPWSFSAFTTTLCFRTPPKSLSSSAASLAPPACDWPFSASSPDMGPTTYTTTSPSKLMGTLGFASSAGLGGASAPSLQCNRRSGIAMKAANSMRRTYLRRKPKVIVLLLSIRVRRVVHIFHLVTYAEEGQNSYQDRI